MRSLNGYLKWTLLIFNILFLFSFSGKTYSQDSFIVYSDFHHVWDGSKVNSSIYLTLTTNSNTTLLSYYTITIPDEDINPKVYSVNRNEVLEPTIHRRNGATDLVIDLKNTPISPEKPVTIKLTYSDVNDTNEFTLLSSVNDTSTRDFSFTYPTAKGNLSWISAPVKEAKEIAENTKILTQIPNTSFVNILLGESVAYEFNIHKNLVNGSDESIFSELILPINNDKQYILIQSIQPVPDKAYMDTDGNYVLQYSIAPESGLDVNIKGNILMENSVYPNLNTYSIENNPIWKISDSSLIRHINRYISSKGLDIPDTFSDINSLDDIEKKDLLYKSIYEYVIENLQPDTNTIGSLSGSERLNAQDVLLKQSLSTNEAYADSVIAIYRYFNIPARLVIGYVSEISNYHPEGIYHYWAEYFDKDRNLWVSIDPFLEDYSNTTLWKRDMFDHISLIYRFNNPNTPKLPYYSNEDLKIEQTLDFPSTINDFGMDFQFEPFKITNPYFRGSIVITNLGNTILDSFNITKSNPDLNKYIDYIENNSRNILLPNQKYKIRFNIPSDMVEERIFAVVNSYSGTKLIKDKYVENTLEVIKENTYLNILVKLLSILIASSILIPTYLLISKYRKRNG